MKTVTIGVHRGKPRLWLEGAWLDTLGFTKGRAYRAIFTATAIQLRLDVDGDRKVSSKVKAGRTIPVIDINSGAIAFTGRVTVVGEMGDDIIIRPADSMREVA